MGNASSACGQDKKAYTLDQMQRYYRRGAETLLIHGFWYL